ncbi:MAG: hypothetical protein MJD61_17000 [Proteobacteria bacterium]|nr:hypothetical protein [Pseudomonadota bacterium]
MRSDADTLDAGSAQPVGDASPVEAAGCGACPAALLGSSCCTDGSMGKAGQCGLDLGAYEPRLAGTCLPLAQPGERDPSCPGFTVMGFELPGCCRLDGRCGGYDPLAGLGCVQDPTTTSPPACTPAGR